MEPLRILVVEDHPLFRRGVVTLLEGVPDLAVAGVGGVGRGGRRRWPRSCGPTSS